METQGARYLVTGVATTTLSQLILVSLLYLIGLGLGNLFGGHDVRAPLSEIVTISDDDISATETRLGMKLPEALRAIYRQQNGGYVRALCILPKDKAPPLGSEEIFQPFAGYDDLHAYTELKTLAKSFLDFADRDDTEYAYLFKSGTDNMVLLAQ